MKWPLTTITSVIAPEAITPPLISAWTVSSSTRIRGDPSTRSVILALPRWLSITAIPFAFTKFITQRTKRKEKNMMSEINQLVNLTPINQSINQSINRSIGQKNRLKDEFIEKTMNLRTVKKRTSAFASLCNLHFEIAIFSDRCPL